MSQPPESAPTPEYVGPPGTPPGPPSGPPPPPRANIVEIDLSRLPSAATAFGISLVGAAVVISASFSRDGGDLDSSNFTMGVLATLGLLGLAAAAHFLAPKADLEATRRATLVSWPGAFGVAGAGLMLSVLIENDTAAMYTAGATIFVLSFGAFWLTRGAPFVVSAIVGAAVLYFQIFDDVIDTDGDGANTYMIIGAAILVFVVAVTAVGWLLPATRVLSAVVVGLGGLVGMGFLLQTLVFARQFGFFSDDFESSSSDIDPESGEFFESSQRQDPFENDVYVVMLCCLLLAVLWVACAIATDHVAFHLLVVASALVLVPMSVAALMTRHPTWWEVGACALGGLILVGATYESRKTR